MTDDNGTPVKLILGVEEFASYEEAETFLLVQESGNYIIVGVSPLKSPLSLEALEGYHLVHSSEDMISFSEKDILPRKKTYEYTR
ncbi:hypothetical protein ACFLWR_03985 [Chloroflexota bacterium]